MESGAPLAHQAPPPSAPPCHSRLASLPRAAHTPRMKKIIHPLLITLLLFVSAALFGSDPAAAPKSKNRDWSLSDIRRVIAQNKDAYQEILVNIAILSEDTLIVTMVTTTQPLSGSGQFITLTYDEKKGWHATKHQGFDK